MAALVVAADQVERLGIDDLVGPQQQHDLDREVAAIDVIAEEEVRGLGRITTDRVDQLVEIIVLAVHVATDCKPVASPCAPLPLR